MKKRLKLFIIFIGCLCLLLYSYSINYQKEENHFEKKVKDEIPNNHINYEEVMIQLREEYNNNDIVGNLEIISSDFLTPIVQTTDNDYYLNHDLFQRENMIGANFLDYRLDIDTSKKLLIYGHSSRNVETIFNDLEKYYDENYYEEHKYLELITTKMKKRYEIFSVYVETEDFSYMQTDFKTEEDYLEHINNLKEKSLYDAKITLSKEDEILILQTCSRDDKYKDYEKKYLLIIGRRV